MFRWNTEVVAELSDESLKAKLEADPAGEADDLKDDPIPDGDTPPENQDDPKGESEENGDDKSNDDEYSKLSKEELVEKLKSKSKEVDTQRSFIEKRRSEIAELKKQVVARKASLDQEKANTDPDFKDKFFDDPEKGVDKILEKKESEKKRQELLNDEYRLETEEFALKVDPEFHSKLDDMVEIIVKELKVPKDRALQFRNDPFNENREILVDLIRRVDNKKLNEKIAALEKKPKEMIDRIEQLSKRKPLKPSADRRDIDIDKVQIASLKDDELANYLKERKDT